MPGTVHVIDHPVIQHKLTLMRRKETSTRTFRALTEEISMLLGYEITRGFQTTPLEVETPIAPMTGAVLEGKKLVVITVLRAGTGMLDGFLRILPSARVGHIGLYRDPKTLQPVEYYFKVPTQMEDRDVVLVDPMLATGNSAAAAVTRVKQTRPRSIRFACILAAPEGIAAFHEQHPDVSIFTPAVDERLDEKGYIVPGLGDCGDRLYGTK